MHSKRSGRSCIRHSVMQWSLLMEADWLKNYGWRFFQAQDQKFNNNKFSFNFSCKRKTISINSLEHRTLSSNGSLFQQTGFNFWNYFMNIFCVERNFPINLIVFEFFGYYSQYYSKCNQKSTSCFGVRSFGNNQQKNDIFYLGCYINLNFNAW